jgi:hypothetical protein
MPFIVTEETSDPWLCCGGINGSGINVHGIWVLSLPELSFLVLSGLQVGLGIPGLPRPNLDVHESVSLDNLPCSSLPFIQSDREDGIQRKDLPLYWFGEAIEEDVDAALVSSIPSSSDQEDFEVSNVFVDPILHHVKVLEISIGIFFYAVSWYARLNSAPKLF